MLSSIDLLFSIFCVFSDDHRRRRTAIGGAHHAERRKRAACAAARDRVRRADDRARQDG